MPKITINRADRAKCGTCRSTRPEVFEEDPRDAMSRIVEKCPWATPEPGEIPAGHESCAEKTSDICPGSIITDDARSVAGI